MGNVLPKMIHSITASDWVIGVAAILAIAVFLVTIIVTRMVHNDIPEWQKNNNKRSALRAQFWIKWLYNLLTTIVSIFPLLGMFGTVWALLGLDLSAGELLEARERFFDALTSTAWGITFAVLFKVLIALFLTTRIEEDVELIDKSIAGRQHPHRRKETGDT